MERLLLKVFCLPKQFMLCGLTLFDFHILEFYLKKKKKLWRQMAEIFHT